MKDYLKILLAVVVLALLVILYKFFISPFVSASELLEKIYEKVAKVEKYSIEYSVSIAAQSDSMVYTAEGSATTLFAHNKSKTVVSILPSENFPLYRISELLPYTSTTFELEYYSIPEGKIMCAKTSIIVPKYSCKEVEPIMSIGENLIVPKAQAELIREWKEKNIVNITYLGKKEFAGRKCDNFRFDVDVSKLMKSINYPVSLGKGVNYTIMTCFDEEFGIELYFSAELMVNYSSGSYSYVQGVKNVFEAKSIGFEVDENAIKLPVELSEIKWLPRFSIIETLCEAGSKEVKLAIKATKDIPSGKAALNVSGYESETIYINKEVDGYNHSCFYLSDIRSGTYLRFSYERMNDTSSRYFIIGIDCPEVSEQRVYTTYGCKNCAQGKYCSMGTYYPSYTFTSDLLGTHEICTWPASERGYLWLLESVEMEKSVRVRSETDFEGMKKNEIKILSFTLPITLKENESYSLYLKIDGFESSGYCSTYKSSYRLPTSFFTKILEKLGNITI